MGLTIRVAGQASKRGIRQRLPSSDRLLADVQAWMTAEYGDTVRSMQPGPASAGGAELLVSLHPAAHPASITADELGQVVVSADTLAVGPGYHTFIARVLERLGTSLDIAWSVGEEQAFPASRAPLARRPDVERAHLAQLARTLRQAHDLRRQGAEWIQVGTRSGTRFAFDGAIGTPLGPRDDAWLERAASDTRVAVDIRPWWPDATDARYLLNRALCILWTEIRWRPPADEDERAAQDEALRLLRRAILVDPTLPYPWREWLELMGLRGIEDPIAERIARQAGRADPSVPMVGYRRRPVTVIRDGWALEVPGSFAEKRTADAWSGGERGRDVTFSAVANGAGAGALRPDAFLARAIGGPGGGTLDHRDGDLVGKARLGADARSGVEVAVLEGWSAVPGRAATIRIAFHDADDWRWAVDLWRSLRPE